MDDDGNNEEEKQNTQQDRTSEQTAKENKRENWEKKDENKKDYFHMGVNYHRSQDKEDILRQDQITTVVEAESNKLGNALSYQRDNIREGEELAPPAKIKGSPYSKIPIHN